MQKCDLEYVAKRIRAIRERPVRERDMKPLRQHLLRLAASSARHGYCQRAGRELAYAWRLSKGK